MVQIFGAFLLLAVLAQTSLAHICNVCDCQPATNEVFSITCDCEKIKHLHLTASMMMDVQSAAMVVIKNCETVSVERNSFSQLTKLDTLGIQNCLRVYLATGAFSNLNSLLINNVQDISFGEMALMGSRGIRNIFIHSSNITYLPRYSLYDVREMDRFTMKGVNIGKISRKAFNVTARSLLIENSTINHVETDGFAIQAQKVMIKKSSINTIQRDSIMINTEFQTRFLENNFNSIFNVNITSPFAEFFGNRFYDIDTTAFKRIQTPTLINNFIFNTNIYDLLRRFSYQDFHDNEFPCNCNMNITSMTTHSTDHEITRNNFCMANCSLTLFDFEAESMFECIRNRGGTDVNRYCTEERRSRTVPGVRGLGDDPTSSGVNGSIQPRFLGVDGEDRSGAERVVTEKLGFILGVVFFVLISCLE